MATVIQRLCSVEEKYGFIKKIGKGSYGDVWIVVPLDSISKGTRYILKRINLESTTPDALEATERETKLLSTLKHPNIIRYVDSFRSWDSYLNIVMYYCEGGDLYTKIRKMRSENQMFEEAKVIEWCIQICMALEYIHERHIVHRDLKTENIFLTKQEIIKVGDFGISRILAGANDLATTLIGTPYYMSPEVFLNKPYGQKSDIWSLGCCMYEIVNLGTAFKAKDISSLVQKVIGGITPEIWGNYSDELKKIIKTMLSQQPDKRPSAKQILEQKYIKQHIVRMLEDTKRRVENNTQRKQRKKRNFSLLPSESEFTAILPRNSLNAASMADLSFNDSRTRRRQKVSTQELSESDALVESSIVFSRNANDSSLNAGELEAWQRRPVENLMYYFEQHEKEDEEDDHHVQIKNGFTSTSNSSPGTLNANMKQKVTNPMNHWPTAVETVRSLDEDQYKMNCRYSDIGNLPDQILLPITGYNDEPLTSLEKAIRPVRYLLSSIDTTIRVAKENAQQHHGILSVDESAAIQLYTMETLPLDRCLYYILNQTLRSANRRGLIPWFRYLKLLMTALWKLPSVQRRVWRGIKNADLSKQYQEGNCYTWWNLSSCTETLTVMQTSQFLGTDGLRTLFSIDCLNGKEIREHSYVRSENEILLPPATYFKVLGKVNPAPDLHIIHVREISPPYELISPPF